MKKNIIKFLLLILVNISVFGQTNKSVILLNVATNNPIVDAKITNKTLNSVTESDSEGKFQIIGNPSDTICYYTYELC